MRLRSADHQAEPLTEVLDVVGAHVELGVAEAVDPQHLSGHRLAVGERQRDHPGLQAGGVDQRAELLEGHTGTEVGGDGSEDIPAGERGPGRGQVVVGVGQLDDPIGATDHAHRGGQEAVVGPDQDGLPAAHLDGHGPTVGADAGVDHRQHHTGDQVLGRPGEGQAPRPDVVGGISWVTSITATSGSMARMTDFTTPTNSSPVP